MQAELRVSTEPVAGAKGHNLPDVQQATFNGLEGIGTPFCQSCTHWGYASGTPESSIPKVETVWQVQYPVGDVIESSINIGEVEVERWPRPRHHDGQILQGHGWKFLMIGDWKADEKS